jgi:hypothetical protein
MRAVTRAGIGWRVVRVWWDAGRTDERRIKRRKNTARLCPVCRGERVRLRAEYWTRAAVLPVL